jgi:hypothetical protein
METLRFPNPADVARDRAKEFQRLAPAERLREIFALMAFGLNMVRASPHRAAIEARMLEEEMEWRGIHSDLFARHAPQEP